MTLIEVNMHLTKCSPGHVSSSSLQNMERCRKQKDNEKVTTHQHRESKVLDTFRTEFLGRNKAHR